MTRDAPAAAKSSDTAPSSSHGGAPPPPRPAEAGEWVTVVRRGKGRKETNGDQTVGQSGRAPIPSYADAAGRSSKAPGTRSASLARGDNRGKEESRRDVGSATRPSGAEKAQDDKRRVRQPRSAAIVLTLSSEAESRGESYFKIMTDARAAIKLPEYGLSALGYRVAQTGHP